MKQQIKENKELNFDPKPLTAKDREKSILHALNRHKHIFAVLIIATVVAGYWIQIASAGSFNAIFGQYEPKVFAMNVFVTYMAILLCYVLLGRELWRRRAINSLLNFLVVSILLLLVELPAVFKSVDYRELLVPKMLGGLGTHNRVFEPKMLYFHRPAHDQFTNAFPGDATLILGMNSDRRYAAEYRYDQNGFRNDRDLERAPVVLIGDSFVEGYKVTQEKIISTQLSQFLGCDVSNLGQCDFGPDSELAVLRILGIKLRPSVVVWFFFEGNDFEDIFDENFWEWYPDYADSYENRSLVFNLLKAATIQTNRILQRWHNMPLRQSARIISQVENQGSTMYFEILPVLSTEENLADFEKFQKMFLEAKSICDQNRIQMLLVYVPQKFRVYRDLLVYPKGSEVVDWDLSDFPDRFARWSEASGISFLDLTPALERAAKEGQLIYYLDDAHWTSSGHKVAAKQIARFIRERGWLNAPVPKPHQSGVAGG